MQIGVIISTYNNPDWLEKVLWGYICQLRHADEIIIADDGSGEETRMLIEQYKKQLPLKHVWHKDDGFQKTRILNKAILASTADYLVFTDQDCVPRNDFLKVHEERAEKGYFLSGGHFLLPIAISKRIGFEDISSQRAFSISWMREQGFKLSFKSSKLVQSKRFSAFMNALTPTKATWNGGNSSAWRKDIIAINGFNEQMKYGGEDREFGERLMRMGIKSKQIRYTAIVIHLDHKRPYKNLEAIKKNNLIRESNRINRVVKTPYGIGMLDE